MSKPTLTEEDFSKLAAIAGVDTPPASLLALMTRIHPFIMEIEEELGEDLTRMIAASLFRVAAVRGLDIGGMLRECALAAIHQEMVAQAHERAH